MSKIFFDSWESLFRSLVITVLAYVILLVMIRVSGKRTLSKMNAFDFIITIALGSSLASVALNKDIALLDGLLVFSLLILMQFLISWSAFNTKFIYNLVTSEPVLLLYKGKVFEKTMKKERIVMDELLMAVRKNGFSSTDEVAAVILETSGDLTVLGSVKDKPAESLKKIRNYPV